MNYQDGFDEGLDFAIALFDEFLYEWDEEEIIPTAEVVALFRKLQTAKVN